MHAWYGLWHVMQVCLRDWQDNTSCDDQSQSWACIMHVDYERSKGTCFCACNTVHFRTCAKPLVYCLRQPWLVARVHIICVHTRPRCFACSFGHFFQFCFTFSKKWLISSPVPVFNSFLFLVLAAIHGEACEKKTHNHNNGCQYPAIAGEAMMYSSFICWQLQLWSWRELFVFAYLRNHTRQINTISLGIILHWSTCKMCYEDHLRRWGRKMNSMQEQLRKPKPMSLVGSGTWCGSKQDEIRNAHAYTLDQAQCACSTTTKIQMLLPLE